MLCSLPKQYSFGTTTTSSRQDRVHVDHNYNHYASHRACCTAATSIFPLRDPNSITEAKQLYHEADWRL